jgi:hypothetical protein
MTRPEYETPADRARELEVASGVARAWGLEARQLPRRYPVDFALLEFGRVAAFLEVKVRPGVRSDTYPTLLLSSAKWAGGMGLARDFGIPVFVVARWDDRTGVLLVDPSSRLPLTFGGRRDRADWQDEEPCVFLPVRAFSSPASLAPEGVAS